MTRPPCVLVVDDDPAVRKLLSAVLTQAGAMVWAGPSVAEAVTALAAWPADVVIADFQLGDETAVALLTAMDASAHRAQVIVISGIESVLVRAQVDGVARVVGILQKPFPVDDLLAMVRAAMPAGPA